MQILNLNLRNVGRFGNLNMVLAPTDDNLSKVTVLVGNNGAGKTTILQALAVSLSWLVARIRSEKGSGSPLDEDWINNEHPFGSISVDVLDEHAEMPGPPSGNASSAFRWTLTRGKKGRKSEVPTALADVSRLADCYRSLLTSDDLASLPLIAFYPVERSVLEIPLKIRTKHTFSQIDGYDNSLNRGVDFRRFFEWFREREDSENESGISTATLSDLAQTLGEDNDIWKTLARLHASSRDRQLTAVRTAIESFMPGFSYLRIQRKPRIHMAINKNGKPLNVSQLSQGEKSMMALVGDIARRLAMMNPALQNPLHGNGIVLIDEVDLHLHPRWQRQLIKQLTTTFPNCQFVLSTHSPLVISDPKGVLCYSLNDGRIDEMHGLFGLDANQVLLQVMDTDIRNLEVQNKLDQLRDSIQDGNLSEAQELFRELSSDLSPDHIELAKAALLIKKLELRRA